MDTDELRALFEDWFEAARSVISELGQTRDYFGLLDKAEERARKLGIQWTRKDAPAWLLEMLEDWED